jgi:tRNA (guanine37-N1)-methyltransferase
MKKNIFNITVITSYKDMYPGILNHSLTKKALTSGIWSLRVIDLYDFGIGKHKKIDDIVYGGGKGLLLRFDVISKALDFAYSQGASKNLIYLTPKGKLLKQSIVKDLSSKDGITILCGHFEGIDERVITKYQPLEISIGDYILSGGEVASFVLIDSCLRLLDGVINSKESYLNESLENHLLEHPHYTKPKSHNDLSVPSVLLSGNHKEIDKWRKTNSEELTKKTRQDLWNEYNKIAYKQGENQ